jgi:hypothetical protein
MTSGGKYLLYWLAPNDVQVRDYACLIDSSIHIIVLSIIFIRRGRGFSLLHKDLPIKWTGGIEL